MAKFCRRERFCCKGEASFGGLALNQDFHFASRLLTNIPQLPPLASLLHPFQGRGPGVARQGLCRDQKAIHLPHFEAILWTPPRQLPAVIQIGFAWLPRLSGWLWHSLHPPQHASNQAPRQIALGM
jgi:hypothetical protein